MFIPDSGSWFLPIPDPGSKNSNKREEWKKICWHTFFCSYKFHKIENYFIFGMLKKKIWANFQRIIELFTQKIVTELSKIWVWDPGSEIRDPEKTYSRSRIQGSKRHRIPDPDPQHWFFVDILKKTNEKSRRNRIRTRNSVVRIRGSGSVSNVTDPQQCLARPIKIILGS